MSQKPYLNAGCGRIILPGEQPAHHALIDGAIYSYPLWVNADRNREPGVDCVVDLFTYPWPWEDNSFDGALLTHLVEHIPHSIRVAGNELRPSVAMQSFLEGQPIIEGRAAEIIQMQDGWYAFFSELYRVLTPGSVAHILSPYGWSQGAITDPTHTRLITEHTFVHAMKPEPDAPFKYKNGNIHFELAEPPRFNITELFQHLTGNRELLAHALQTQLNVAYDISVKLRAIK